VRLFFRAFRRFLVSFLRLLVGFLRVLHGFPGQLVRAQVISFSVLRRGSPMSMGRKFVQLGGPLMGIARHGVTSSSF
jgi:hypothetical protein